MNQPSIFAHSDHYSEGVVRSPDGRLFYSMTAVSTIVVLFDGNGESGQRVWGYVPGANGHAVRDDGTHVVMSSTGAVVELDATGRIAAPPATHAGGEPFVYPNGVALDAHRGGFYLTDSGYKEMPQQIEGRANGRLVRVSAGGRVSVVAGNLAYANGVGLAPDGDTLYVTESVTRTIWAYAVTGDGSLGERRMFARVPEVAGVKSVPDGITMARDGTLYVAHYGAREVLVYAPSGTLVRRIPSGNRATSHVALDEARGRAFVSGGVESEQGAGAIFCVQL